jgi:hypothetical protein
MLNLYMRRIYKTKILHSLFKSYTSYTNNQNRKNEHDKYKKDFYYYRNIYNTEFVHNFFYDPKVEQYLEDNFNIDKCLITNDTLEDV